MPSPLIHSYGGFSYGKKTQTAGTVIVRGIWPYFQGGAPAAGVKGIGVAHVTTLVYQIGTTGHTITWMRPFNYTTFSADAAASQAVVNLTADPGSYSTAYKYPLPNGQTAPRTANNGIAGSDYVCYQAADGTWVIDTVSSVSSLAVTLTTNLPTGGVKAGGLLYFYGITTDTNPQTAEAHQQLEVLAAGSGTVQTTYTDPAGLFTAINPGDPLILHSSNGTTAGTFEVVSGFFAKH